jgi:hypothetical protein
MDLSLAKQVDRGMREVPVSERLAFLFRAERKAEERGDQELLRALAQWRLKRQVATSQAT